MKLKKRKRTAVLFAAAAGAGLLAFSILRSAGGRYDTAHLTEESSWEEGTPFTAQTDTAGPEHLQSGMQTAASGEALELLINPDTAQIAVFDKRNDKIWYAAPNGYESDVLANHSEKDRMASQIAVLWYDSQYRENSFYSKPDSVDKKQFEVQSITDGIRIIYTMGEKGGETALVPKYITRARMEEKILSKLTDSDRKYFQKRYVESDSNPGFLELPARSMTSEVIMKKLQEILITAGYTEEDLEYENQAAGYETENTKPYAVIPVEYTIKGAVMSVRIPLGKTEWEESIQIKGIELLNYFGAGGADEDGYLFVPSGSGALIQFNNGKTAENSYSQNVYGTDPILLPAAQMQSQQTVRLPVFGLKNGEGAWLASIEEGAAIASVSADIGGRKNSWNHVYSTYLFRSADSLMVNNADGGGTEMKLLESGSYGGDIRVEYQFLAGGQADYSGMAGYYRRKLIEEGKLKPAAKSRTHAPFYLDLIGSIQKTEYAVGIPIDALVTLTDTGQAEEILTALGDRGISGVTMRYLGWFNRGVNHDIPETVSPDRGVGGKKDWDRLVWKLEGMGGSLYPDVSFWYSPWNGRGLNEAKEAARLINGRSVTIAAYDPALLTMRSPSGNGVFYLVSPNALPKIVSGFLDDYEAVPSDRISLRDLGDILVSDKGKKRYMDRETSMLVAEEQINRLAETSESVMIAGGNQYALAAADHVVDVPTGADRFYIIDEQIPFYEMVIRGSVLYTGKSVNLMEVCDGQEYLLNMIECGAAPHVTWTWEDTEKLAMTPFEQYYSTNYRNWLEEAARFYEGASELWAAVQNSEMTRHLIHENGVREIRYANGAAVFVNYSGEAAQVGGISVDAQSYQIRKAGESYEN